MLKEAELRIDLSKVDKNVKALSKDKVPFLVIKANCYGVGNSVIKPLFEMGYKHFAVSTEYAASEIIKIIPEATILIMTPVKEFVNKNFIYTISTIEQLKNVPTDVRFHIKFDTLMGRLGIFDHEVDEAISILKDRNLLPHGIYSHVPSADDVEVTLKQIDDFKLIVNKFKDFDIKCIHLAQSQTSANYDIEYCNMVRIGLGMWGLCSDDIERDLCTVKLDLALSLVAPVLQTKEYKGLIGYNLSEEVDGKIHTVRFGYADGLPKQTTGFKFQKEEATIVGKVCMCQVIVQSDKDIEELEIFGDNNSIYELTSYADRMVYELLVNMSPRIVRKIIN
ncbi:MAG: alanine racemase [Mycoplasmatales bacterium]